jgi:hypothetical protein
MAYAYNRECPFCKRPARSDATVCPSCTRAIPLGEARFPWLGVTLGLLVLLGAAAAVLLNR